MERPETYTAKKTEVEMTQMVLPQFTNSVGTVFGGQVVSWMDICAAVSAQRHAKSPVVTASIDSIHFLKPIKQGQVVVLKSKVNAAFQTSMEIGISVEAENPQTGERYKAMRGYFTFVSLSPEGRPQKVHSLVVETKEEQRRLNAAFSRREERLKLREKEVHHEHVEE